MKLVRTLLAAAALALPATLAVAYPDRPITLIVPSPPGGGTDVFARQLAEIAEPALKQKVVVENKPGGGGTVGTTLVTAAKPDGYTFGFVWNSPVTTSPHSLPVAYTPDSYQAVLSIGYSSYVLCVQPDFPAANAKELIAAIKAAPGKYTYGNDGVGGTMQLAAERIFKALGLKVRSVPFGGAGETAKNFLGGHVDFYGGSLPPILAHAKAGKAKCLILTSPEGNPALPEASGLDALGIGQEATVLWWAMIAPKNVPADRLAVITKAFTDAAKEPRFKEVMEKQGAVFALKDAAATDAAIRAELAALGEVAKAIGVSKGN
ncbi:tripartite tricarboxylate transporter substrate binding protein [Xanthobacter sp. KR7-225]|uniref:tripartite tricarboxylate transporter substrate binding protein n=1 Tax=Xanthobacter sp. KR7-225 TaxID=3156613 RepID=UPI0032B4BE62